MAYSKDFHDRARIEIRRRRDEAERIAKEHKLEMVEKYQEFQFIENQLSKTGFETMAAFSLPQEEGGAKVVMLKDAGEDQVPASKMLYSGYVDTLQRMDDSIRIGGLN